MLMDLDGVIRHFDPGHVRGVEAAFGIPAGQLLEVAFDPSLLTPAITGATPRSEWVARIGVRLGSPEAATAWASHLGTVDEAVLQIVDRLRASGVVVAVLTNGTDTIRDELRRLRIGDRFDAIFNSYDIGVAKPDVRAFRRVCDALDVDPTQVFFTDDSPGNLAGAVRIGMHARQFVAVAALRDELTEIGAFRRSDAAEG